MHIEVTKDCFKIVDGERSIVIQADNTVVAYDYEMVMTNHQMHVLRDWLNEHIEKE